MVEKYQTNAFSYFVRTLWFRARKDQNISLTIIFAIFVVLVGAE